MSELGKVVVICAGGGAAGIHQVGQLHAFQEMGIEYDWLHGTSVGSINGAMYHAGQLDRLKDFWLEIGNKDVYNFGPVEIARLFASSRSLYDSSPLWKLLNKEIDTNKMLANSKPFCVMATNLYERTAYMRDVHESSDPLKLIFGSASPPILFPPIQYDKDTTLVDGGMTSNAAIVDAIHQGADTIVLLRPRRYGKPSAKNFVDMVNWFTSCPGIIMLEREMYMVKVMNKYKRHINVIDIQPEDPTTIGILDFDGLGSRAARQKDIDENYKQAKAVLTAAIKAVNTQS